MIEAYEAGSAPPFELYALGLAHKHIPEIMQWTGLRARPLFVPSVGNFAQGMLVQLPLHHSQLPSGTQTATIAQALQAVGFGFSCCVGTNHETMATLLSRLQNEPGFPPLICGGNPRSPLGARIHCLTVPWIGNRWGLPGQGRTPSTTSRTPPFVPKAGGNSCKTFFPPRRVRRLTVSM